MVSINNLIHNFNWDLLSWSERYGNGVWVIIGPDVNHIKEIREIKDGGDIESLELGFYLKGEGSWLPAAFDISFEGAIAKLENKISPLIDNKPWRDAVYNAFECIMDANDGNYGLKIAKDNKNPNLLFNSFK